MTAATAFVVLVAGLSACVQVQTDPVANVTSTTATLKAHVTGDNLPMTYWFQYGKSTSYGTETTHRNGGSGSSQQAVAENVTGLTPGSTYHYRVCANDADGTNCGADKSFNTGRLRPGFSETTVFSGLSEPTAVRFSLDGRVFVAERGGLIKVFSSLNDTTPTTFADLRTKVFGFWDSGMLGMALDPSFPVNPYVYVLYTYDAPIGGTAPRWGDTCPNPPASMTDGCVVSGRLSRLQAAGDVMTGSEQVLINAWCQQNPVHSIGDLTFGTDGALYASAGEGANPNTIDYGQFGGSLPNTPTPKNPCGDPPGGVGSTLSPPTAAGGSLRSQSPRWPAGRPRALSGTVIRVDRATGAALPDNPWAGRSDPNERRIVAYGLRNPFRFTRRPATGELWVGDVGWSAWEEINRLDNPLSAQVKNFGWPCYEGNGPQPGFQGANLDLCNSLYSQPGSVTPPFFAYRHGVKVVPGESCASTTGSSVSGISFDFYGGGTYPPEYDNALFFADRSRRCIWAMLRSGSGLPDRARIQTFVAGASNPVDLQVGPGGELFYADFDGGTVKRISFTAGNGAPTAVATATPSSGSAPLTVQFDGTMSSDPDPGDTLTYAWDLDGDGAFDDSTATRPGHTYTNVGTYSVRLRVTDSHGATGTDLVVISAGNSPPAARIDAPSPSFHWAVGDPISFSGSATDAQDGTMPASRLSWSLILYHCGFGCHTHALQEFPGVAGGSFAAPDHEYPSYLELKLTATDSGGLKDTASLLLVPRTVDLTLRSVPAGLTLGLNASTEAAPFTRTVIAGSANSLSAPTPQTLNGTTYTFGSWSDGGAATHTVRPATSTTYTATYAGG